MIQISRTGRNNPNFSCGFSLIELLLVLTIASVIVTSISLISWQNKDNLKSLSQQISNQLRLAQHTAMRNEQPYQVEFNLEENKLFFINESLELPEDISMTVRTAANQVISDETVGMTFYPDASSSGGIIMIENDQQAYEISVIWISGKIMTRQILKET